MEEDYSFFESECTPQLECLFTEKKVELLLFKLPDRSLVLLLALGNWLESADVLHNIVWQAECLGNIDV